MKLLFTVLTLLLASALAQGAFVGDWQGTIGPDSINLGVTVHFTQAGDALAGTLDIPAQNAEGLALTIADASATSATFTIQGVPGDATFDGSLEDDTLSGTFTQNGQEIPFTLERKTEGEPSASGPPTVAALLGSWQGTIDPDGANQRAGLEFKDDNGVMSGSIIFPDQGATFALSIREASKESLSVVAQGAPGNLTFTGTLKGDTLTGTFSESGSSYDATFERTNEDLSVKRPQRPEPPFPYRSEDVTVTSGDVTLAGTLTLPEGEGPFPAVLMLTGSGAQDRDETLFGHKPFLLLADTLTRAGFATLRLDDRGTGASGGDFSTASYQDFVADVLADMAYLESRPEIAPARIGLLGHSEGGYIAPLAIADGADAAFLIEIAGPSVNGLAVLKLQNYLIYKGMGADDAVIDDQLAFLDKLHDAVAENRIDDAKNLMREQVRKQFAALPEAQRPSEEQAKQTSEAQAAQLDAGWFRDFLTFDPQPYLQKLTVPTLAIYGKLDIQVPAVQNSGVMEGTLTRAGNKDFTVVSFDDANHFMQPSIAGSLSEYGKIETTMKPEVLELIADWLTERFGN